MSQLADQQDSCGAEELEAKRGDFSLWEASTSIRVAGEWRREKLEGQVPLQIMGSFPVVLG